MRKYSGCPELTRKYLKFNSFLGKNNVEIRASRTLPRTAKSTHLLGKLPYVPSGVILEFVFSSDYGTSAEAKDCWEAKEDHRNYWNEWYWDLDIKRKAQEA